MNAIEAKENLALVDDSRHAEYIRLAKVLATGELGPDEAQLDQFACFCRAHGKGVMTFAARRLIEMGKAAEVLTVLFRVLGDVQVWGRNKPNSRYGPDHETWGVKRRRVVEAFYARNAAVAGWLLGIRLPKLPSVSWSRIASTVALHTERRSKVTLARLNAQVHVLENAKPFAVTLHCITAAWKRPRHKKGEVPSWVGEGTIFLQQSGGRMTDAEIARKIGVSPSTLSRSKDWFDVRSRFDPGFSAKSRLVQKAAKDAKTTPKRILLAERTECERNQ